MKVEHQNKRKEMWIAAWSSVPFNSQSNATTIADTALKEFDKRFKEVTDEVEESVDDFKSEELSKRELNNWMSYDDVKSFFNYKATQMCDLIKKLEVSKIGRRIYVKKDSIEKFLEQNIIHNETTSKEHKAKD